MSVNPDNLYLKVLNVDGSPCHGGTGTWHLPRGSKPGQWMPPVKPVPCQSGYHVLGSARQALEWIGPAFFLCEVRGEVIDHSDKFVAEQARLVERLPWDDRSARLFAADCAEDVLPIFERDHPGDDRPRCAIEAARLFADGLIGSSELAAARAAARDAAWDAQAVRLAGYLGIEP